MLYTNIVNLRVHDDHTEYNVDYNIEGKAIVNIRQRHWNLS